MKPWVYTEGKDNELRRSSTHSERLVRVVAVRRLAFVEKVPLLRSSKNMWKQLTQGLRPGLCRSVALAGLFDISPNQFLCYFDAVALPESGESGSISTATLTLN